MDYYINALRPEDRDDLQAKYCYSQSLGSANSSAQMRASDSTEKKNTVFYFSVDGQFELVSRRARDLLRRRQKENSEISETSEFKILSSFNGDEIQQTIQNIYAGSKSEYALEQSPEQTQGQTQKLIQEPKLETNAYLSEPFASRMISISKPSFWINSAGKHPIPGQIIRHRDVTKFLWCPTDPHCTDFCRYVTLQLEKEGTVLQVNNHFRKVLLICDPQNDFCDIIPALVRVQHLEIIDNSSSSPKANHRGNVFNWADIASSNHSGPHTPVTNPFQPNYTNEQVRTSTSTGGAVAGAGSAGVPDVGNTTPSTSTGGAAAGAGSAGSAGVPDVGNTTASSSTGGAVAGAGTASVPDVGNTTPSTSTGGATAGAGSAVDFDDDNVVKRILQVTGVDLRFEMNMDDRDAFQKTRLNEWLSAVEQRKVVRNTAGKLGIVVGLKMKVNDCVDGHKSAGDPKSRNKFCGGFYAEVLWTHRARLQNIWLDRSETVGGSVFAGGDPATSGSLDAGEDGNSQGAKTPDVEPAATGSLDAGAVGNSQGAKAPDMEPAASGSLDAGEDGNSQGAKTPDMEPAATGSLDAGAVGNSQGDKTLDMEPAASGSLDAGEDGNSQGAKTPDVEPAATGSLDAGADGNSQGAKALDMEPAASGSLDTGADGNSQGAKALDMEPAASGSLDTGVDGNSQKTTAPGMTPISDTTSTVDLYNSFSVNEVYNDERLGCKTQLAGDEQKSADLTQPATPTTSDASTEAARLESINIEFNNPKSLLHAAQAAPVPTQENDIAKWRRIVHDAIPVFVVVANETREGIIISLLNGQGHNVEFTDGVISGDMWAEIVLKPTTRNTEDYRENCQGNLATAGSFADFERTSKLIKEKPGDYDEIYISRDCHRFNHIAHPDFWSQKYPSEDANIPPTVQYVDVMSKCFEAREAHYQVGTRPCSVD
jgi:hypothetical protein